MIKNNTILVTGGAGYIGSQCCKSIKNAGKLPVVVDNMVNGHPWAVKWGPLVKGNIADRDILDRAFSEYRPDAVIHFAAYAYVAESIKKPAKYFQNNICGTISLLDAMRRHGCGHIVFSSSCATYGLSDVIPICENCNQIPINPYGRTKLMVEQILKDYDAAYGFKFVSLRYFNAAGADPEGELGEDHTPETHLIPLAIEAALGKRPLLEIYGNDYDTQDGTAVRDYVHVSDLADTHMHAIEYLSRGGASCCLNLGTGRGHSVRQVVASVEKVSGKKVNTRMAPRRTGDPAVLFADASRATDVLGWAPRFTSLEAIVESAWRWHRRQID